MLSGGDIFLECVVSLNFNSTQLNLTPRPYEDKPNPRELSGQKW